MANLFLSLRQVNYDYSISPGINYALRFTLNLPVLFDGTYSTAMANAVKKATSRRKLAAFNKCETTRDEFDVQMYVYIL